MQRDRLIGSIQKEWSLYGDTKETPNTEDDKTPYVEDGKTFTLGMSDTWFKESLENAENTLDAKMRCIGLHMIKATKEVMVIQSAKKYKTWKIQIVCDDPEFYNQIDKDALEIMIYARTLVIKSIFEREFKPTNVRVEWYQHDARMKTWISITMNNPSYPS